MGVGAGTVLVRGDEVEAILGYVAVLDGWFEEETGCECLILWTVGGGGFLGSSV